MANLGEISIFATTLAILGTFNNAFKSFFNILKYKKKYHSSLKAQLLKELVYPVDFGI